MRLTLPAWPLLLLSLLICSGWAHAAELPSGLGRYNEPYMAVRATGDALKLHEESRAYYAKVVTQRALAMGRSPFCWDTGSLLDRSNNVVLDAKTLGALMEGARQDVFLS